MTSTIPFGTDNDLMEESVQDENDSEVQGMSFHLSGVKLIFRVLN